VDAGLHAYEFVEIPAQPPDAADCTRAASPEPVGSVGSEGSDRTDGAGVASLIASECLPRDQVIRGTSSIGCCAAEDADGIAPGWLIPCAASSRHWKRPSVDVTC
jgi:hypothetical protein